MEPFLNGTIPPSRGHRLFSPSEGERERYRRYCGLDAGGERCPHSRGRGSFALGGRRPAKGGTRHLRFLIPPLATPPDLPLAATPCGRASKMRGERRFYVCALFLFAPLTFSFVICRAYQCAAGLVMGVSVVTGRLPYGGMTSCRRCKPVQTVRSSGVGHPALRVQKIYVSVTVYPAG